MSNKRRSLSDALDPVGVEEAFIQAGGAPHAEVSAQPERGAATTSITAPVVLPPLQSTATAHLSVRINVHLMDALLRAGMTRKSAQQEPFTHSGMVSEALRAYLKKLGILV